MSKIGQNPPFTNGPKGQKSSQLTKGERGRRKDMNTASKEFEAVTRRAIKAWHTTERKHREALQTVVRTRREMAELERIIRGGEHRPAA